MLEPNTNLAPNFHDKRYHEKVQWKSFSHICTAQVESDDELSIVTGAEFEVSDSGEKRVTSSLSKIWDCFGVNIHTVFKCSKTAISAQRHYGNALPIGPPISAQGKKLLKFVDTTELVRGPQDLPGYWVVSGARLMVDKSKILLRAKFSLLAVISGNEETYSV